VPTSEKIKNVTKILTLVNIIEKHDSGQKHSSSRVFRPELDHPESATPVMILKSRDKRDSPENW
jgi:hypothetical protein